MRTLTLRVGDSPIDRTTQTDGFPVLTGSLGGQAIGEELRAGASGRQAALVSVWI